MGADKQIKELFELVEQKRKDIFKVEKMAWLTNCSFSFEDKNMNNVNIQACSDLSLLTKILGYLKREKHYFDEASKQLNYNGTFKWNNFTYNEWENDIMSRFKKIIVVKEKEKLKDLEDRLNNLISPEYRRELELEQITKILKNE